MGGNTHRTNTRSAATVWNGEGFVQVEVHHIKAQVTGADDAEQSVQVCAVAVHQAAAVMNQLDHSFDVFIEHAECIRVREHHPDDCIITGGFERFEVHVAAGIRWDGDNAHAHHAD